MFCVLELIKAIEKSKLPRDRIVLPGGGNYAL